MLRSYCSGKNGSIRRRQKSEGSRRRPWQCGTSRNTRLKTLLTGRRQSAPAPASATVKAWSPGLTVKKVKQPKMKSALSLDIGRHLDSFDLFLTYFAEYVSEGDCSAVTPDSSIHTETLASQRTGSPSSAQPSSAPETPLASVQSSPVNYTQDFVSASQSLSRRSEVSVFHSLYASKATLVAAWSILRLIESDVCYCYQGSLRSFSFIFYGTIKKQYALYPFERCAAE